MDSCAVGHAAPPEPTLFVPDEKVKVELVGWPVEVKVPLNPPTELPKMVNVVPVGNDGQPVMQVTVAIVPLPEMVETKPPTNAVMV